MKPDTLMKAYFPISISKMNKGSFKGCSMSPISKNINAVSFNVPLIKPLARSPTIIKKQESPKKQETPKSISLTAYHDKSIQRYIGFCSTAEEVLKFETTKL